MRAPPLLVVSDVHLPLAARTPAAQALAALIAAHRGHELVLAGDTLNLSTAPATLPAEVAFAQVLAAEPALRSALSAHLARGDAIRILAGNHDAALARPRVRAALLAALELTAEAPLEIVPWFLRRGAVHVEHGHLFDPDNAPAHPLVVPAGLTEPLGVAITRRLLRPHRALAFVHEHDTTPLRAMLAAGTRHGWRAPVVVAAYFAYAVGQCATSLVRQPHQVERWVGDAQLAAEARARGIAPMALRRVLAGAPRPTHTSTAATFQRLYLDRALATLVTSGGLLGGGLGSPPAALLSLAAATYLATSVLRSPNRYAGRVEARLRAAADLIGATTGAKLVVFGHSHTPDDAPRYVNVSAFGYPRGRGRPYAVIDVDSVARLRRWTDG